MISQALRIHVSTVAGGTTSGNIAAAGSLLVLGIVGVTSAPALAIASIGAFIAVGVVGGIGGSMLGKATGDIMFAMVSFGNIERIVFIDKQLAWNLDKYYDDQGYMKWNYQMSYAIGTRLMCYWLAYPFIRHRVTMRQGSRLNLRIRREKWRNSYV